MNGLLSQKSPRRTGTGDEDTSKRRTGVSQTPSNDQNDDDDVLMDDDDPEEKLESSDESEEDDAPTLPSRNAHQLSGKGNHAEEETSSPAESDSDEKDTTLEDDDDDSTADDSDSSETSDTPGNTSLSVDEIDQLIRDNPTYFVPPPQKLPDLAKIAASAGVLSSFIAAKIAEEEAKPAGESTNEVELKEETPENKPQKNVSVVQVPTTYFSPKQMRRIMAHVTSLHNIRISHPSVKAVSIAMEHFIRTFIQEAYRHAQRSTPPRTVVGYADMSYVAQHFTSLYFLQDFVPPAQTANVVVRTLLENDGYDVDTDLRPSSRTSVLKSSADSSRKPGSFNFKSRAPLSGSKTTDVVSISDGADNLPREPVIDEEESDDPEIIARRRALLRIAKTWDGVHIASNWRNGLRPPSKPKSKPGPKKTPAAVSSKKIPAPVASASKKRVTK